MKFKAVSGDSVSPNRKHCLCGSYKTDLKGECFVWLASMKHLRAISLSCLASMNAELTPGLQSITAEIALVPTLFYKLLRTRADKLYSALTFCVSLWNQSVNKKLCGLEMHALVQWPVLVKGLVRRPFKVNSCLFSAARYIFVD